MILLKVCTTFLCAPLYTQAHTAAVHWDCIYMTKEVFITWNNNLMSKDFF